MIEKNEIRVTTKDLEALLQDMRQEGLHDAADSFEKMLPSYKQAIRWYSEMLDDYYALADRVVYSFLDRH